MHGTDRVLTAFPQLYYEDLAGLMHLHGSERYTNAASNVLEAIRKIKMRQLYNGGITLWDGESSENWWATVYAAHFLLEAQKAGFDVDKSLIESILAYLNGRLRNKSSWSILRLQHCISKRRLLLKKSPIVFMCYPWRAGQT